MRVTATMRSTLLLVLMLLAASTAVDAQQRAQQPARQDRTQLETQFRRTFARVVRQRVGLSDEQMARLAPVVQRFASERRRLQSEERSARQAIQRAIRDTATADSASVSQLLQRLMDAQKRRVQLLEAEQRELGGIMTPLQRARFMALQQQVRREVDRRRVPAAAGQSPSGRRPRPEPR